MDKLTKSEQFKKISEWIKQNKVVSAVIAVFIIVVIVAFMFLKAEAGKTTTSTSKVYSAKIEKVSVNSDHDWKVEGTTDAPDGAEILIYSDDDKDNNNEASNLSGTTYAKVHEGKFEAVVEFINLATPVEKDTTEGAKIYVKVIAVTGSVPKFDDGSVPEHIQTIAKDFKDSKLTVTADQVKYSKSLDDDSEESDESSDSEDSSSLEEESSSSSSSSSVVHDDSFYASGITYEQIARNPKEYLGKGVTFTGKVLQTIEDDGKVEEMRVAVDGDYDQIIYVQVSSKAVKDDSRILEDDIVTLKGMAMKTITYEATSGASITLPAVYAVEIDDQGKDTSSY